MSGVSTSNFPRLWLLDDTDMYSANEKLKAIRDNQLKEWDWCRFCDDDYPNKDAAFEAYISEISGGTLFNPGKMIVFYGMPSFQALMATRLNDIAENVLVIIMGKIDKTMSLYLKAKDYKYVQIEEKLSFDKGEERSDKKEASKNRCVEWTEKRAQLLGLTIDWSCCCVIADACSYKPNLIHAELYKLKHAAIDGEVTRPLVEMVASNIGDTNIMALCDTIIDDKADHAHLYLQRLIEDGEDGVKMCGFFMDWARRMALAQDTNFQPGDDLKTLKKQEKQDDGKVKPVQMYESTYGILQLGKKLKASAKSARFPYDTISKVGKLQIALRGGDTFKCDNQSLLLHRFIASLMS